MELSSRGIALATAALKVAAANRAARAEGLPPARPAIPRPDRRPAGRRRAKPIPRA
jgi:hypothetical protein